MASKRGGAGLARAHGENSSGAGFSAFLDIFVGRRKSEVEFRVAGKTLAL